MTKRLAPSGIEYFNDPETSYFKKWFNNTHVSIPDMNSKDELHQFVLESLVYLTASDKLTDLLKNLPTPMTPDRIRTTNEVTTYEMFCFFLSHLDIWLYQQKHADRTYIMTVMIECLVNLSGHTFSLSKDALRNQIHNRLDYFPSLESYEQISEAIAHQVVWGIEKIGHQTQYRLRFLIP